MSEDQKPEDKIKELDKMLKERDAVIIEKSKTIDELEKVLAEKDGIIQEKDDKIKELETSNGAPVSAKKPAKKHDHSFKLGDTVRCPRGKGEIVKLASSGQIVVKHPREDDPKKMCTTSWNPDQLK